MTADLVTSIEFSLLPNKLNLSKMIALYRCFLCRSCRDKCEILREGKLSSERAVIGYTRNGAYISFQEGTKGTLEVGKVADFAVLSQNLFELSDQSIRDVTVNQTFVVEDELVYDQARPDQDFE
tara:strand:- start:2169 stop:2540 length:372 start_codon:yes stop_codon:yes gene_type:complete